MPFFKVGDLPVTEVMEGVWRRAVYLDNVMLTFLTLSQGGSYRNTLIRTSRSALCWKERWSLHWMARPARCRLAKARRSRRTCPTGLASLARRGYWTHGTRYGRITGRHSITSHVWKPIFTNESSEVEEEARHEARCVHYHASRFTPCFPSGGKIACHQAAAMTSIKPRGISHSPQPRVTGLL